MAKKVDNAEERRDRKRRLDAIRDRRGGVQDGGTKKTKGPDLSDPPGFKKSQAKLLASIQGQLKQGGAAAPAKKAALGTVANPYKATIVGGKRGKKSSRSTEARLG